MWHLVFVTLCGWLSGMEVHSTLHTSHPHRVTNTKCQYSYFSWWWAHSRPKHVEKINKYTKKTVHQVGFIYKIFPFPCHFIILSTYHLVTTLSQYSWQLTLSIPPLCLCPPCYGVSYYKSTETSQDMVISWQFKQLLYSFLPV